MACVPDMGCHTQLQSVKGEVDEERCDRITLEMSQTSSRRWNVERTDENICRCGVEAWHNVGRDMIEQL